MSNSGCPSLIDGQRGNSIALVEKCKIKIAQIYSVLTALNSLKIVIITARGPTYSEETGFGAIESSWTQSPSKYEDYFVDNSTYNPGKKYFETLEKSVSHFTKKGVKVFIFLENPELGFSPKSCINRPFGLVANPCVVSFAEYSERMIAYRRNVKKVVAKYTNVYILDPEPLLCDSKNCYARIEGEMLYADDDHFSVEGSRYIAKQMINKVVEKNE
jgi:hypothetical protein